MRMFRTTLPAFIVILAIGTATQASLILHWDLDGNATTETVSGNTTNTVLHGPVQTGQDPLAPTGSSSIWLPNTSHNNGSAYISAGTLQSNGVYAAGGGDGTYTELTTYTVTAWFELPDTTFPNQDRVIVGTSRWANTAWMLAIRGHEIVFDFGNNRRSTGINVPVGGAGLIVVQQAEGSFTDGSDIYNNRIGYFDGTTWTWVYGTQKANIHLDNIMIGAFQPESASSGNFRYFVGGIDDVRIYDHVLSDAEIAALLIPEPFSIR